jgi:hypothetical protein
MDFSYLDFTGSLLILGVFSVCVAITLCRFLLAKLEMPPLIALGDQSPGELWYSWGRQLSYGRGRHARSPALE